MVSSWRVKWDHEGIFFILLWKNNNILYVNGSNQ